MSSPVATSQTKTDLSPPTEAMRLLSCVLVRRGYTAMSSTSWLWMPLNLLMSFSLLGFQSCSPQSTFTVLSCPPETQ